MAALDLATLKLRCAYKSEGNADKWDLDRLAPWQEDVLWAAYRGRVFEIVEPDGEVVGTMRVHGFRKDSDWEEYGGLHDAMRDCGEGANKAEVEAFSHLFTDEGFFKRDIAISGHAAFQREVTDQPYLVLLDTICIKPEYREKGVGSWAVQKLFDLDGQDFLFDDEETAKMKKEENARMVQARKEAAEVKGLFQPGALEWVWKKHPLHQTVKYLFVHPRSLESQLPQSPDATHTLADLRKTAEKTSKERVLHIFHKMGFRRVGKTSFLCMSKSSDYRSRLIPADGDAREKD
ncbi:hypothetical protein NBRC10512_004943 [Rhodotorula toruloides]|uniref:RHTO0S01e13300g1_1 n=2 Tax=Rhodotorula toruloides TaxID=5286 RepID=A0A061AES0_RHOTO|nr:acyl-CoA N-acyltransferase domain containing protein [Rhodotorula toruloides NP11]EMS24489.1 acyl-CoA N-acyltransferase domain containing protein [Rhodotorula toruloides NP11]CDR36059.1 RHTO0S01e13300g1_1 [Rhodotorula toruloides]